MNFQFNIHQFNIMLMKKLIAMCAAAFMVYACQNDQLNSFNGFIVDATSNNVTVKALTGDETHTFSLENADKKDANGLLIGNLIIVDYRGNLTETTPATRVATDATYAKAIGTWTMPDPIDTTKQMGFELMIEGKAQSINMATLVIDKWELQGEQNKIVLQGESIGNGQTIEYGQTATIIEKDGKTMMLFDGTEVVYEKQK